MDKFKQFKVKLLKKLREMNEVCYWRYQNVWHHYSDYTYIDKLWKSFLKIPDQEEIDVTMLVKKTVKGTWGRNCRLYPTCRDKIAYDQLMKTLHKVGFKYCGIKLKSRQTFCDKVCTIEQEKCGLHSREERRKVKIHQFLKDQFDPIGLRDVVNLTSDYVFTIK